MNEKQDVSINASVAQLIGLAAIITVLIASASACSSNLTRAKAEELIRSQSTFPASEEGPGLDLSWDHHCFNQSINPCGPDAMPAEVRALQSLGLVTVAFDGDTSRISLTEKGQKFAVGTPTEGMGETGGRVSKTLKVGTVAATLDFGTVTGITEVGESKVARVEYTVISKPTPFGENPVPSYHPRYALATIPRTATFMKYDDGWRITGRD